MRTARLLAPTLVTLGLLAGTATAGTDGPPVLAEVKPVFAVEAAHAGAEVDVGLQVRLPEGIHVNSNRPRDPSLIPLTLTADVPPGVVLAGLGFPRPTDLRQRGQDELLSVFEHTFLVGVRLRLAATLPIGPVVVPVRLRYQACDEARCYRPMVAEAQLSFRVVPGAAQVRVIRPDLFRDLVFDRVEAGQAAGAAAPPSRVQVPASVVTSAARLDGFVVVKSTGGYLTTAEFLRFLRSSDAGPATDAFEGRSALMIVLVVLAGGLALNLTPCVLPLIPINLAILGAGTAAASRRRGFLLGSAYGGAMAVAYGSLGAIVVLTSSAFGAINASPWFNGAVAVLFVALGLALFDVFFIIDFSRFSTSLMPAGARGSVTLAASTGALAALLAGACVAPVVIQVIVFSSHLYASGTRSALGLPFVLGLGMAAPWPLAGAGLAGIPRPGAWMVRVKQVFGVVTLLLAGYYAYTAYELAAGRPDRRLADSAVSRPLEDGWHTSLGEALDLAARERRPVFVDLWATWCKNCLVMDKTTLADPAVRAELAPYIKVKFQAEDPDAPPVRDVMARLGAVGLPTYVVLQPRPNERQPERRSR